MLELEIDLSGPVERLPVLFEEGERAPGRRTAEDVVGHPIGVLRGDEKEAEGDGRAAGAFQREIRDLAPVSVIAAGRLQRQVHRRRGLVAGGEQDEGQQGQSLHGPIMREVRRSFKTQKPSRREGFYIAWQQPTFPSMLFPTVSSAPEA